MGSAWRHPSAPVLCIDKKPLIRALDRTQPLLPMRSWQPERSGMVILSMPHRRCSRHRIGAPIARAFDSNDIIAILNDCGTAVAISQHSCRTVPLQIDTEMYK